MYPSISLASLLLRSLLRPHYGQFRPVRSDARPPDRSPSGHPSRPVRSDDRETGRRRPGDLGGAVGLVIRSVLERNQLDFFTKASTTDRAEVLDMGTSRSK